MSSAQKMMGFESPSDQKVPVRVGDWNALKLAAWRSRFGFGAVEQAAINIIERCKHSEGCAGAEEPTEPCLPSCPDRELRMDAFVILNSARTYSPSNARKPGDGSYFAPSREYFSEVLAELAATQLENAALREALRRAGVEPPPPPNEDLTPKRLVPTPAKPQLEEKNP